METDNQMTTKAGNKPQKLYTALSMQKAKKLAGELTRFLDDNKLVMHIAGRKYVPVEGWQFLGETQLGLTSVITECDPVPTEGKEIKYKAVVEVMNQQGTVISRGFAWCSNSEKKKRTFEEYAVASMAQTRAIGKAYRNILAWIVKLGGYEATPFEEVDKDRMEDDLSKVKAQVFKTFKDNGINDSGEMIDIIKRATGKEIIENSDEAMSVIGEIESLAENKDSKDE